MRRQAYWKSGGERIKCYHKQATIKEPYIDIDRLAENIVYLLFSVCDEIRSGRYVMLSRLNEECVKELLSRVVEGLMSVIECVDDGEREAFRRVLMARIRQGIRDGLIEIPIYR